jgi:hypothetical protein
MFEPAQAIDLFVVPTISFRLPYGLLVLQHSRPEHPSAEWIARQLIEASDWSEPPRYIIRDRDGAYGERGFHSAPHSNGHTGSEADRIDPAGLPRSRRDL